LFKAPFGGKTPFTAEVWFVNRSIPLDVKWGTGTPIQLLDPKFNIMLPVRAFGQYGVRVDHSIKFLKKLVGTTSRFDRSTLTKYFRGEILRQVKDMIATEIVAKQISILHISANLNQISNALLDAMRPKLEEYGLALIEFNVNSINTPEDDPAVMQLKGALSRRAELDILGTTYQQERSFDTLTAAAENTGGEGGSGLMGAGIGLGVGLGVGAPMGSAMGNLAGHLDTGGGGQVAGHFNTGGGLNCDSCNSTSPPGSKFCNGCGGDFAPASGAAKPEAEPAKAIECDKCSMSSPHGSKFCAVCGDPFILCPACGTDNPDGSSNCRNCAEPMPRVCPGCDQQVAGDTKFCPKCGHKHMETCGNCSAEQPLGTRFCAECGTPMSAGEDSSPQGDSDG
jgi:membrane protease subunit (stomatin/prohibitin family)